MSRLIFYFVLALIGLGTVLHLGVEVPWVGEWIGTLPGDLLIKKNGMVLYVPLTSAFLCSVIVSFVSSILFKD